MYYFASDIHLGSGDAATVRRTERRFVEWLTQAERDARAVYLVGDIFDFRFEYRHVVPKGFVRTLGKLAQMSDRGIRIVLFTGNHDMWLTDYLTRECGVEIVTRPQLVEIAGRRLFIAHGDNMNIGRQWLLRFMNGVFRSRVLRVLFSWLVHPDLAVPFGKWWSGKSRKSHGSVPQKDADGNWACLAPLTEFAEQYAAAGEVDDFIFGHMHVTATVERPSYRIYFMGDWLTAPNCLMMDDAGEAIVQKILD